MIWRNCLQKRVTDAHIPIPGLKNRSLDSLPPRDLERLVYRALELRKNWNAESPVKTREAVLPVADPVHVVSLNFIRNGGRSLLVSLRLYTNLRPRVFHLEVWDLEDWLPRCVAQRKMNQGEFRGMATNSFSREGEAIIVLSNGVKYVNLVNIVELLLIPRGQSLEVLGFDSATQDGFSVLRSIEAPTQPVQFLSGSLALMRHTHHPNLLRLLDVSSGQTDLVLQSRTAEPVSINCPL